MRTVARWCVRHRHVVLVAWLCALAFAFLVQSSTGSTYASGTKLSGTESAQAATLLARAAPSVAGDTERVVIAVKQGTVTDPQVRARVDPMLTRLSHLPNVSGVTSPYGPGGAAQVSKNGKVAFATVDFSVDAKNVSAGEAKTFVNTARAPNRASLQVDVVGSVAATTNPSSQSSTFIGVAAALVVLLIVFGAVLPALLPLISTGIALIAALSIIGILSNTVTMASFTSQLCTLIGLGVGVDYSLFVLTRTRSNLRRGLGVEDAIVASAGTAGRAVLFAGITVCIALLGMLTVGVSVLSGAAIAASIAVLFPMLAAQTLLPALMADLGLHALTRKQRHALAAGQLVTDESSPYWNRWARHIQAHRLGFGLAALAVMVALAAPFVAMRQGTPDFSTDPTTSSTTTLRAYELLARGFGPGFSGPLQLVAPIHGPADQATFGAVTAAAGHTSGVVGVGPPTFFPAGPGHPAVAVAQVLPAGSPQATSTSQLITRLRSTVIPQTTRNTHLTVLVGGQTALGNDFAAQLSSKLPIFVLVVVALSFILLMVVFRSLLIPATAALMNLLSAAAAFGVIVAIFQWGWLGNLVGAPRSGPIQPLVPILMFAVLFGLSMDYEVFLVSRMHEEWLKRRDNAEAVDTGLAITGRTITSAAFIMIVVFAAFVTTTDRNIKMIGLGMATAIALDALIVRTMLVPAIMHTLGRANWYLPPWLERRLPHLDLDDDTAPAPERELASVGS
jgi:RND superfamily putative drug exporter